MSRCAVDKLQASLEAARKASAKPVPKPEGVPPASSEPAKPVAAAKPPKPGLADFMGVND